MIAIIAGGRDYELTRDDIAKLDALPITEVVHGDCTGVDRCADQWARYHGHPVHPMPAQWDKYGKAAGPVRNREMVAVADICILFPGGRGTEDMYRAATEAGMDIYDFRGERAMEGSK